MLSEIPVVTIDGPSGSGKGTVSKWLANKLGWNFLDSGAIYRVLALYLLNNNVDLSDEEKIAEYATNLPVKFNDEIVLENKNVTNAIRTESVGNYASKIAVFSKVRKSLLERQRQFLKSPGLVADGRDMGTIVFPKANLKIFLEATPEERAKRRYFQLIDQGYDVNLGELIKEVTLRDNRDKNRAVAPLVAAKDAITIDTTNLTIEEVCSEILSLVEKKVLYL